MGLTAYQLAQDFWTINSSTTIGGFFGTQLKIMLLNLGIIL